MSSTANHISLVVTLRAYDHAEALYEASAWGHADLAALARSADRLHDRLLRLAMECGFDPAREHRGVLTVDFARKHAERVEQLLTNNLREVTQDNAPTTEAA